MFSKRIPITRLSHVVIGYMILAFGWWSFHLWQQNERLFAIERQLLEARFSGKNNGLNITQLEGTAEYAKIVKTRRSGRLVQPISVVQAGQKYCSSVTSEWTMTLRTLPRADAISWINDGTRPAHISTSKYCRPCCSSITPALE